MKRAFSIILVFVFMISIIPFNVSAKVPTPEDLNGYSNVCLTYTFRTSGYYNGRHYKEDLLPYTAYIDKNGTIKDFFFDSYLFLPCMDFGPSGARMHVDLSNPTKAIDWTTYVEDTFHDGANVDALEAAFGETKKALGNTDKKAGVFFTILYPAATATDFGKLNGRQLNFSNMEDRKYAVKWMIDEQIDLFNEGNYQNLELVGFYWLEEFVVSDSDKELLNYASEYLHSKGLKFIWIPWYCAEGYAIWKKLGFDVACMQPNLYWMSNSDPYRVEDSCNLSKRYGLSMEMELDARVVDDDHFDRYLDYLEGGLESGLMNSIKMYYQDGKPGVYYQACYSNIERYRTVYDLTYKYAKSTLTKEEIDSYRPEGVNDNYVEKIDLDEIITKDVAWYSIGKKYSGCRSFVDGNGMAYQDVSGRELTDGIIATDAVTTDWHAFHNSIHDEEGRLSVTIDLGEVKTDITDFVAHFDNRQQYGIGSPSDVRIMVSQDGVKFMTIKYPELIFDRENCYFHYTCNPITARYVRISFLCEGASFVFCSEFLVGTKKDSEDNDSESEVEDDSDININNDVIVDGETDNGKNLTAIIGITAAIIGAIVLVLIVAVIVVVILNIKKRRK